MRIDQTNYESFFLSYIDGELNDAERQAVDAFCKRHPDEARELALLQQTVVTPALTVFSQKDSLYREEEDRRVFGWYLWRAAAMLVLIAGSGFIYWTMRQETRPHSDPEKIAVVKEAEKKTGDSDSFSKQKKSPDSLNDKKILPAMAFTRQVGKPRHVAINAKSSGAEKTYHAVPQPEKNRSSIGNEQDNPDQAAQTGVHDSEEPAMASVSRRQKHPEAIPLQPGSGISGGTISMPGIWAVAGTPAVNPDTPEAPNVLAATDRPSDPESPTGDDAVSIIHLAKNGSPVKKLFRRITSGRDGDAPADNSGNKTVNISIFQFALGK